MFLKNNANKSFLVFSMAVMDDISSSLTDLMMWLHNTAARQAFADAQKKFWVSGLAVSMFNAPATAAGAPAPPTASHSF